MTTDYRSTNSKPFIVAIGPSSYAQENPAPLEQLRQTGVTVISNPFGRRLNEVEIYRASTGGRRPDCRLGAAKRYSFGRRAKIKGHRARGYRHG